MNDKPNYPTDLFIGGAWRDGGRDKRIAVFNPSDGSEIGRVANADAADAITAVDAAANAAASWAATPARKRSEILRKCFELMTRDAEALARLISLENGKALKDARGEVAYAAEFFRWFAEEAVRINGDFSVAPWGANRILVQYQPIGVSLLITPWNFPAAMATRKIAPALAAGCTCVLKPATETPLTAYAVAKILAEAGVPDGVVNVLTTSTTSEVVNAMLEDPRVRKLSFTGSTEVGRVLLRKAADQVIHCSMELGGNAPFVVFDDADIDKAIEGAMVAKMRNGGEACTAANRFYVQRGVAEEFSRRLTERMSSMRVGAGANEDTDCGPLVNAGAVAKVAELVDEAVSRGAKVLCGGKPAGGEGYFFPPTVLLDVALESAMAHDEIFGPVAPIYVFDTEEEAVRLANDTEYGLVAYVYTRDLARGLRVCERIEAGMLALNRGLVSDPAAPFGGVKQSGLGREGAHHGMLEFMEAKYIATDW
ncbi:NAD-dependent succinate-semialdehyde dehydrogenase [Sinorhizobium medicae]|uniref:NAD-dependent succinate-semialdehyde dehydrogenase n=1 Tax=Sinorhizobium medicae TaxID=110321 RepID=UPI000FD9E5A7|nr:NAD-dependent succinate-semialdehyde dehydrogenase [Sinorhizobium medicae]MBO1965611.1 NAD-dependent succinate-semialdehyde dehydrogenase [Sinorhizobium medicae]RVJ67844.1 NAD-dependent succinate-semialdehyde dehydrogenase [Sinorhizobium medicae]WQO54899.1 NAD-dependent succinate-semialdehyde dehydrogenase [Sinorhizobium medicae]WQP41173.1 NAD-dependent succinate-semialdehyde dehydrogenase [Sinorhizobium medicae]